jgi:hypothetical protein
MSDIARSLLAAIDARMETLRASGQSLEDVNSHFTLYTEADLPPEWGIRLPAVFIKMRPIAGEVLDLAGCMTEKQYPVVWQVLTRNAGNSEKTEAAEILDLLEDGFNQRLFDLAEWMEFGGKHYQLSSPPPFSGNWNGAGELVYIYTHVDTRELV